jgi:hypothetical protein
MANHYKFEMIRSDDAAQIITAYNVKVTGVLASEVIETFTDFLQACGFHRNTILDVYSQMSDELSQL